MDCLEGLKQIGDQSVDCVITDPPYFLGFKSTGKELGREDWGNQSLLAPIFDALFKELARVLKPNGRIFMFTHWKTYPALYLSAIKHIRVSNLIVWDFEWIKAGRQFRFTHELILHATMPEAVSPKNRGTSDVWRIKPVNHTRPRLHLAQKPVEIIRRMLEETTEPGDLILDCFMGSGTTAVACKQTNRNFIGFEIRQDFVEVANKRLELECQQDSTTNAHGTNRRLPPKTATRSRQESKEPMVSKRPVN